MVMKQNDTWFNDGCDIFLFPDYFFSDKLNHLILHVFHNKILQEGFGSLLSDKEPEHHS